jgi:hypothetical protein
MIVKLKNILISSFPHIFFSSFLKLSNISILMWATLLLDKESYVDLTINFSIIQLGLMITSIGLQENLIAVNSLTTEKNIVLKEILLSNTAIVVIFFVIFLCWSFFRGDANFIFFLFGSIIGIGVSLGNFYRLTFNRKQYLHIYVGQYVLIFLIFCSVFFNVKLNFLVLFGIIAQIILLKSSITNLLSHKFSEIYIYALSGFKKVIDYFLVAVAAWFYSFGIVSLLKLFYHSESIFQFTYLYQLASISSFIIGTATFIWNPYYLREINISGIKRADKKNRTFYILLSISTIIFFYIYFIFSKNLELELFHKESLDLSLFHGKLIFFLYTGSLLNLIPAIHYSLFYHLNGQSLKFRNIQIVSLFATLLLILFISFNYAFIFVYFSLYVSSLVRTYLTWYYTKDSFDIRYFLCIFGFNLMYFLFLFL